MTVYLGPETPRWTPSTEADLASALDAGLLNERHWLDVKREIGSTKGANRELARDLASFAVDGGSLLVGVEEADDGTMSLHSIELGGLPERIEQIARSIPDPPLPVTCTSIPSAKDPAAGYVLVQVPASGLAPHMVDGVYYGRGDKTKYKLGNAEIVRLHERMARQNADAGVRLDWHVSRDPIPKEHRNQAHLFVVATPVRPRAEMLLDVVYGSGWENRFNKLLTEADTIGVSPFSPDIREATLAARRADGAAMYAGSISESREFVVEDRWQRDIVEVEISEDGEVRLFMSRLSDTDPNSGGQVLLDVAVALLTRRVVQVAGAAADHAGYLGQWSVGVAATGIASLHAYRQGSLRSSFPKYDVDQDKYRSTTIATHPELTRTPGAVTKRLVGRLLRALGKTEANRVYLDDTDSG